MCNLTHEINAVAVKKLMQECKIGYYEPYDIFSGIQEQPYCSASVAGSVTNNDHQSAGCVDDKDQQSAALDADKDHQSAGSVNDKEHQSVGLDADKDHQSAGGSVDDKDQQCRPACCFINRKHYHCVILRQVQQ